MQARIRLPGSPEVTESPPMAPRWGLRRVVAQTELLRIVPLTSRLQTTNFFASCSGPIPSYSSNGWWIHGEVSSISQ